MLTPEQYQYLQQQRQALEAEIAACDGRIEQHRAKQVMLTTAMTAAADQVTVYDGLMAGATPEARAVLKPQRDQQNLVRNSHKAKIEELQAAIEAERTQKGLLYNRLGVFRSGGIAGEIRTYEKVHGQ
jgi:hypothetical protein